MAPATSRSWFAPVPPRYSGVAINVGGAVIPLCLSVYLATVVPSLWQVAVATGIMAAVSRSVARIVPGRGIVLPVFVPPVLSALLALLLAPGFAAPCAYVAGTVGTLVGADVLNLRRLRGFEGMVSLGGAGLFDGIFLVGIVAVLLTAWWGARTILESAGPGSGSADDGTELVAAAPSAASSRIRAASSGGR